MRALLAADPADEHDGRVVALEERCEALGVALVRQTLVVTLRWIRRIALGLGEKTGQRLVAWPRAEVFDVDAGRDGMAAVEPRPRPEHVVDHPLDVLRPGEDGGGIAERTREPTAQSSALPRIENSSSEPCAFTAYGPPTAAPTGPPRSRWFVSTRSAGRCSRTAAAFASHEALALGPAEILDASSLHVLVAVDDEHRQEPAHIGPDHRRPADVVPIGMRILAEDDDLVPEARPGAREAARVHIRSGAAQEIAVPDENLHHCGS